MPKAPKPRLTKAQARELARRALGEDSAFYDDAPVGLCVLDADLRYVRVNRRFVTLSGRPVSSFIGKTVMEVFPKAARRFRTFRRDLIATGKPIRDIAFLREKESRPGVERSWVAHWFPIRDAAGRFIGVNIAFDERTDREALIEQLDHEQRRLTAVLEQLPMGVVIAEAPGGRLVLTNKAAGRIFRHAIPETNNVADYRKWKVLRRDGWPMPPEEYPLARAILSGAIVTGEELVIVRGDGTRGVISANAAPIRDARGKIVAGAVTFSDVTQEREMLEALRVSESKFRRIAENSPFGLGTYTSDGRITFMNPKLTEIVGYRLQDVPLLKDWFELAYPDAKYRREVEAQWGADIERVQRGKLPHSPVREYRFVCRDGSVKNLEITFALGEDVTYAMFNDVTERRRAEEALRAATEFTTALLESAPIPIYVRDAKHRYRLVNREWEKVFGKKREAVIGRNITEILPGDLARYLERANREVLAKRRAVSKEERIEFADGEHTFHTVKFPLRNAVGKVDAVGGISLDMTDRIRAEEEIKRLNKDLEQRVIERTDELATANRELRREIAERLRLQSELLDISEREQRRLGQDLHDELGQQLTGLGMMFAAFEQELKGEGNAHVAAVAELSGLLRRAVTATRDLAKGFYPVVLEQGGLRVALQDLSHRTNAIEGVRCVIRYRPGFRFAKAHAIHLYRIAQEAVSNALKHGKPRTIEIALTVQRGRSVMRIVNDGRAFKLPSAGDGGFGLHLMRYRARYIGAEVAVGRGAKGGCEVVCTLVASGAEA